MTVIGFPYTFPFVFGRAYPEAELAATLPAVTGSLLGGTTETVVDYEAALIEQCEEIVAAVDSTKLWEERLRRQQPLTRLWDGDWNLMHICQVEYKATWSWISNDSGPGRMEIPYDSEVARWINDFDGRVQRIVDEEPYDVGRNVHVTVDYCGARWSGRLDKCSVEQREDGDQVLVCDFLHDYENLKWYS